MIYISTNVKIDKIKLGGIIITDIFCYKALQRNGILDVSEDKPRYCVTKNGEIYSRIFINKDEQVDRFTYTINDEGHVYSIMEISVDRDDGFENLFGMNVPELINRLEKIKHHFFDEYGIVLDFSKSFFRSIEVQKTFLLDKPFAEYARAFSLLFASFPGTLKLNGERRISARTSADKNKIKIQKPQVYEKNSGKRGIWLKLYDKKAELKAHHNIDIIENYARFEITMKDSTKIKRSFGTNRVYKLSDENIDKYFSEFIQKNVAEAYEKYKPIRIKQVEKILKQHYVPKSRTWVKDTILNILNTEIEANGIPLMLSLDELIPLLDKLPFGNRQNKHNAKLSFVNTCKKLYLAVLQEDDKKYSEVIEKLKE